MNCFQPWGGVYRDFGPLDGFYRGVTLVIKRPAIVLPIPANFNEEAASDPDHNAMCGAASLAWSLTAVGVPVTQEALELLMRAHFGEYPSGSSYGVHSGVTAAELQWAGSQYGVDSYITTSLPDGVAAGQTVTGYPAIVCVWCTPQAVPCSADESKQLRPTAGLGHFVVPVPSVAPPLQDAYLEVIAQ